MVLEHASPVNLSTKSVLTHGTIKISRFTSVIAIILNHTVFPRSMDKLVTEPQRESRVISSFINTEFRFLKDHDRQSMLECGEVASLELPEIAETLILKTEKDSADETNIQNTIDHHRSIPPCDNGGLTDDRTETIPETERETEIFLESDPKSLSGTESSVESDTRLTAENLYQCSIPQPDAMDAQEFIAKDDKSRISEEDNLATEFDNLETGYTPDKDKTVTVRHRNNASDDEDDEPGRSKLKKMQPSKSLLPILYPYHS